MRTQNNTQNRTEHRTLLGAGAPSESARVAAAKRTLTLQTRQTQYCSQTAATSRVNAPVSCRKRRLFRPEGLRISVVQIMLEGGGGVAQQEGQTIHGANGACAPRYTARASERNVGQCNVTQRGSTP